MIREFPGNSSVRCSKGALTMQTGFTICAWVRPRELETFQTGEIFMLGESSLEGKVRFEVRPNASNQMQLFIGTRSGATGGGYEGGNKTLTNCLLGEWMFLAATKVSGKSPIKFYGYNPATKTWDIQEIAYSCPDPFETPGGVVWLGDYMDSPKTTLDFIGDMAAVAAWNSVLTEEQIKSLPVKTFIEEWESLSPDWFASLGQHQTSQAVKDWTGGGGNQTSLEGTAVLAQAPPQYYSAREQITWAPITDILNAGRTEEEWPILAWANTRGTFGSGAVGWKAGGYNGAFISRSGAFYKKDGEIIGNAFSALAIPLTYSMINTVGEPRTFSVWLQTSGAGTGNGYQLQLLQASNGTGSPKRYKFLLRKFIEGSPTVLEETGEVTIETLGAFALAKVGGELMMFRRETESSEWVQVGSAHEDHDFSKGYAGLDGNGSNPTLNNFKTGELEGPLQPGGAGVKVKRNGVLVEAKRWIKRNGVLVEA